MFSFITVMLEPLNFLSCRSEAIPWDEAVPEVTMLANTHTMLESFRRESAEGRVYPTFFLEATHKLCEKLYLEHLAPHIKLLGQPQYLPNASASDIADVDKKPADRHVNWVDPYTTDGRQWRNHLDAYWGAVTVAMAKETRIAIGRKEQPNKIKLLTNRHLKVVHLWRNKQLLLSLGLPLSTPVPLLCKSFVKSVNDSLVTTGPAVEMVRFTLNWSSSK